MHRTISILAACPRTLVTELLVTALSANESFRVIAHVSSTADIAVALEHNHTDIVLLDGDCNGRVELINFIRSRTSGVNCIVLLEQRDRQHVIDCFRAGARGVFLKSSSEFSLLCKCIQVVSSGQIWVSNEELAWIIDELERSTSRSRPLRVINAQGQNLLSRREEDVVRLLMDGMSNRDIARSLDLSEHTIKNYLFRIFDKLGVSSRTELLLYAMSFRLNEPKPPIYAMVANAS